MDFCGSGTRVPEAGGGGKYGRRLKEVKGSGIRFLLQCDVLAVSSSGAIYVPPIIVACFCLSVLLFGS